MKSMLMEWVLTSALLILVVITLRALLGRRISAGLRYALWAVVLIRLLVPLQFFSLPVPANLPEADREPVTVSAAPAATFPAIQGEPVGAPVIAAPHPGGVAANYDTTDTPSTAILDAMHLWDVLGWLWLAGTMVMTAAFLFSNLAFALRLRRVRVPLEGAECPLPVYLAENLPSPCLFGLVRPSVYVTAESAQNPAMLRHVLAHEYTHFRHGDYVWNLLRSVALAVHWWNPLVWLAVILNRRDCELACDEGTLKRLGDDERFAYGRTLLALITVKPRPGDLFRCATTMTGGQKSVFDRVTCIARAPKRWLWAAVVAVIATALACVYAFGQAAAPEPVDAPDITADLTFSLDENEEGTFVRIEGSVDGIELDHTVWFDYSLFNDTSYPLGRLMFDMPLCGGEAVCSLAAYWMDESRSTVRVTAAPTAMISSYVPSGNLVFTVILPEGTLLELEGHIPKLSANDPELVPTEAEAVRTARIAAKLLMGAEDYYQSHAGDQKKNQNSSLSELSFDELDLNAHPGIGFRVVYESDQFIIFWGAPGLFGYDLVNQDVTFDVDFMKAYGEQGSIQGSHATYVEVSPDGRSITIKYDTPDVIREAYYIDVPTLTYQRRAYEPMESIFGEENAVGYVMPGAKISDTVYIRGDKVWRIFDGYNINESSNPIFNTSEEPPISDLAMSAAVPDFLTDEQQTLYRRAYTLYQAMFGGDTLGIDSFGGASEANELYASERAETTELDGIEYLLAVNRYRNWESFDSTIHAVFTDSFWAEKNKVTYSDDLVVPIYRESEGRLAMLSFSRGSGMYYNPNFPDEFELKRKTDTSISFSLFGHYSFMYPLEGETETERDSRVENGFEVTYEFSIRMVQTDAGWRFDEFHSALADEWIAYTVDG